MTGRRQGSDGDGDAAKTGPAAHANTHAIATDYRAAMAAFLEAALRLLNDAIGPEPGYEGDSPDARAELQRDPFNAFRLQARLLMTKSRLHVFAVLAANHASNLHSLAVQMRPALECAGQVVLVYRELFIAINPDPNSVLRYVNRGLLPDHVAFHQRPESERQLIDKITAADPMGSRLKARRFNESDTVKPLDGGPGFYSYLSNCFQHSTPNELRGPSHGGGVMSKQHGCRPTGLRLSTGLPRTPDPCHDRPPRVHTDDNPRHGPIPGEGVRTPGEKADHHHAVPQRACGPRPDLRIALPGLTRPRAAVFEATPANCGSPTRDVRRVHSMSHRTGAHPSRHRCAGPSHRTDRPRPPQGSAKIVPNFIPLAVSIRSCAASGDICDSIQYIHCS